MTTKRITDERREQMIVRVARCYALHMETPDVRIDNVYPDLLHDYTTDVDDLLHDYAALESETQEKQTQIDAMRPIVEAIENSVVIHDDDGLVVLLPNVDTVELHEQARAFVAAHPTNTAAVESESEIE